MPHHYEYDEPELFLEHPDSGIKIFHCYKNDNVDLAMDYWYVVENEMDEYDDTSKWSFDVRDLDGYTGDDSDEAHKAAIIAAIDAGQITVDGYEEGDESNAG